ncbi:segregation/condensation protein A [Anaerosporomusa subterranea]|uniref:Segregation and condensation protein A n=1 Tax=Anaerosporomusa subterranea TaxID=1794912 RepID=A0A154BTY8_ANASB|nr:segregation/condensation protein A [Anaerosporomusa subterranea]KYZ77483.1 segregation/condensation protein A [Anaerosporomusa subterranea]
MDNYKIRLEVFEGPLDLLLHLIEKNQLDIYDIPITLVTEQYLNYLRTMQEFSIDVASEFLLMAATLLQIKSRLLLPRPPKPEVEEDELIDPRQELVERLIEYRKYKEVARFLEEVRSVRERYFSREPQSLDLEIPPPVGLSLDDLILAFAKVWESDAEEFALVAHDEISVQDKISDILTLLSQGQGKLEFFQTIIRSRSRNEVVTAFIALLELVRTKRVVVSQENRFGPIYLKLRDGDCSNVLPAS